MACNCIGEINGNFLATTNTRIVPTLVVGRGYSCVSIVTEEVDPARHGEKAVTPLPTYCPFCGERYAEDDDGS